jgi:hypothetical protein
MAASVLLSINQTGQATEISNFSRSLKLSFVNRSLFLFFYMNSKLTYSVITGQNAVFFGNVGVYYAAVVFVAHGSGINFTNYKV